MHFFEYQVYTLVFSLIMLNTDLHNPLVPKKMSLDAYLKVIPCVIAHYFAADFQTKPA